MRCIHCQKEFEGAYCESCWNRLAFGTPPNNGGIKMSEDKKQQWIIEHDPILGTLKIKEFHYPHTPIAQVATPQGDWMSNPQWKKRALTKAHLLSTAPVMYDALLKVKAAMDLENSDTDLSELYNIVQSAINEATYERGTETT